METALSILEAAEGNEHEVESNFHHLFQSGLFDRCFPGFKAMDGCVQSPDHHAEGDVLVHTGKVFAYASQLKVEGRPRYLLLVAALLHDMCKPDTWKQEADGHISFFGHAEMAAERCPDWCGRIDLEAWETELVTWLVRHHMDIHMMLDWGDKRRLELYQSPHFPLLVELQEADIRACWQSPDGTKHGPILRDQLLADRQRLFAEAVQKAAHDELKRRITRRLTAMGYAPGPLFGQVNRAAQLAAKTEYLGSDEALDRWIKSFIQ